MEGFFALRVWGAYIWRGLYIEGLIFRLLLLLFILFRDAETQILNKYLTTM